MASVKVQYNCGCGYKTDLLEAAKEHADKEQHVMTVSGEIRPILVAKAPVTRTARARAAKDVARPVVYTSGDPAIIERDTQQAIDLASFSSMKDRIKRKK